MCEKQVYIKRCNVCSLISASSSRLKFSFNKHQIQKPERVRTACSFKFVFEHIETVAENSNEMRGAVFESEWTFI